MKTGRWKNLPWVRDGKGTEAFLFPVRALSKMFRAKWMEAFTKAVRMTEDDRQRCFAQPWVVYAKEPACGVERTLEYIARYAYRVAISDRRIQEVTGDSVTFEWKDYKEGGKAKLMTLDGVEFFDERSGKPITCAAMLCTCCRGDSSAYATTASSPHRTGTGSQPCRSSSEHRRWTGMAEGGHGGSWQRQGASSSDCAPSAGRHLS